MGVQITVHRHLAWILVASLATPAAADTISGKTTPLYPSKQCKTKIAGGEGQDDVLRCPALKGYDVEVGFSAELTHVKITDAAGKSLDLSGMVGDKLEWRITNGKPFAVIVSIADSDMDSGTQKAVNEKIVVRGLPGFTISGEVDAKQADAWKQARALADGAFEKQRPAPKKK